MESTKNKPRDTARRCRRRTWRDALFSEFPGVVIWTGVFTSHPRLPQGGRLPWRRRFAAPLKRRRNRPCRLHVSESLVLGNDVLGLAEAREVGSAASSATFLVPLSASSRLLWVPTALGSSGIGMAHIQGAQGLTTPSRGKLALRPGFLSRVPEVVPLTADFGRPGFTTRDEGPRLRRTGGVARTSALDGAVSRFAWKAAVPTLAYASLRLRPRMLRALREGALLPARIGRFEKIAHAGVLLDHAPVAMGLNHRLHVGNLMADDDEEAA